LFVLRLRTGIDLRDQADLAPARSVTIGSWFSDCIGASSLARRSRIVRVVSHQIESISTHRRSGTPPLSGPVCCEIVRSLLQTLRVHIYTLVQTRLLVDHEYNIYCLNQCPDANVRLAPIINSSLSYIQATSSRIPECFLFQVQNSHSAE
jgi:hypothetical protein